MRALAAAAAGAVVTAALIGGVSLAVGTSTPLYACVANRSGAVRMVSATTTCARGENKITWNVEGPQGPAGAAGAPGVAGPAGPQGEPGPAGSGIGAVLIDANGVSLGEILPWSTDGNWYVWDGASVQVYNDVNGIPNLPLVYQTFFTGTDCTGTPYAGSPVVPDANGGITAAALPNSASFDGRSYFEATTGEAEFVTVLSYFDAKGLGPCTTGFGYSYSGDMWPLTLGQEISRPALPFTPLVQP